MDRHPLSVKGIPIPFKAVDDAGTFLREDAFAFREMPYGFDLYIGSIVPPVLFVSKRSLSGMLRLAVNQQKFRWDSASSFQKETEKTKGFSVIRSSLSVVVRYRVSETLGILGLDVSAGMLKLDQTLSTEEYARAGYLRKDSERIKLMLDELLIEDSLEQKRVEEYVASGHFSKDIRKGMITLFSHACRSAAVQDEVPFIGLVKKEDGNYLKLFPTHAVFSRAFRDPLGLINLLNLCTVLDRKPPLFSRDSLLQALPGAFLRN